jgi:lambda repressor-like predicted transcriptional regulator
VNRHRRLRKLTPDPDLFRRRATGATFRALALDDGVSHTALSRYFARPEAREQLKQAKQQLRAEQQAAAAHRSAEQRLERDVRRQATRQAAREREQLRQSRAVQARIAARRPTAQGAYADWLDEHDLRRPVTRAELYSRNDDTAAGIVSAGGGIQAVVEATDLRTRENVLAVIDPAILVQAFRNDAAARAAAEPDRARLRRLVPDRELVRRRAQGETLRRLACDYGVAHTTLSRWFRRPLVAKQLKQTSRQPPAAATAQATSKR